MFNRNTNIFKRGVSLELIIIENIFERLKNIDMGYNWKLMISPLKHRVDKCEFPNRGKRTFFEKYL